MRGSSVRFLVAATVATLMAGAPAAVMAQAPVIDVLSKEELRQRIDRIAAALARAQADAAVAKAGSVALGNAAQQLEKLREEMANDEAHEATHHALLAESWLEIARIKTRQEAVKQDIAALEQRRAEARVAASQAAAAAAKAEAEIAKAQAERARAEAERAKADLSSYKMRQSALGQVLVLQDVLFAMNSTTLAPGARERLEPLIHYLTANPEVRVRIEGHTDSQGSAAYNQQLSQGRAESVAAALIAGGIAAARIKAIGMGETRPLASNATPAGRQENRRVEITLMSAPAAAAPAAQPPG